MPAARSPLDELSDVVKAAKWSRLDAEFDLPKGRLTASITGSRYGKRQSWYVAIHEYVGSRRVWHPSGTATSFRAGVKDVAQQFPGAVLRPETVKVAVTQGKKTGVKLALLAVRAWHQVFGLPVPTPEEVAKSLRAAKADRKKTAGDAAVDLKAGPAGVKKFNRIPLLKRAKIRLRKADLAGADLTGAKLAGVDLTDADLSGANLSGAKFRETGLGLVHGRATLKGAKLVGANLAGATLQACRCHGADFSRADLTGVNALGTEFRGASFVGANLTDVDLYHADLRGADFTGATLTGNGFTDATFDEKTKWPKGYELPPPDQLKWKGAGPDPRLAPTKREKKLPPPADFPGFLDRLKKATDAAKLDKAMAMLKADRFRLFAKVDADQVVGVVKSQSVESLVYSCRLGRDGKFACCTQNLNVCGGLRGSPCKHLLVLIVGLTKAGELDPATAHAWSQASRGQKPELDKDAMTETFLQYKGAEAGTVDWRPTETIPEDFYAV